MIFGVVRKYLALISAVFASSQYMGCELEDVGGDDEPVRCEMPEIPAEAGVVVENGKFLIDGTPFLPQGLNSYPLLQHIGEGNTDKVLDIFDQAQRMGRPFVRTNAFMDGGENPARIRDWDGTIREQGLEALDVLLDLAGKQGIRLLLVLTNNWRDYGGAQAVVDAVAPGENLPKDAFWSEKRAVSAQIAYVQTIVSRVNGQNGRKFGEDPAVFGWVLANEPRCEHRDWCDGDRTLVEWARHMADALRAGGATQPIAWGGAGYLGKYGENLEAIAKDGAVDILTLHFYPEISHPTLYNLGFEERVSRAISIGAETMANRAALAERENMPLIVEEFGWRPPPSGTDAERDRERALVYNGWLRAALRLNIPVFPWMIGESARPDYDGFLIREDHLETVDAISCDFITPSSLR